VIARLSGRVAALLAGGVVLVVLLAGWFLLVSPQRSKAASLGVKIDQTQAQVASTQAYVDSPATRRAVHDLARLRVALPDDPRMSQILRQLSATAGLSQISLDTITPAAAIPSAGGEALPISVSVTGHYFNISRFLHLLRNRIDVKKNTIAGSGRLYSVDGIQFAGGTSPSSSSGSSDGSGAGAAISATIMLNSYLFSSALAPVTGTATTADATSSP
jgi:hypothetical protein